MIDKTALAELASDPVIIVVFKHLAKRTNDANLTTADQVQSLRKPDGAQIGRHEACECLKSLATAGCGRFRIGRRGKATRLEWGVSAKETAEQALAATNEATNAPPLLRANGPATFSFRFPLRHDFEFRAELPLNWDADARQRLANAILALPTA